MGLNEFNKKENILESTSTIKNKKSIAEVRAEIKQVSDDFFKEIKFNRYTIEEIENLKAIGLHKDSPAKDFFSAYEIIGIDYKDINLKDLISKVRHLYNIFLPHIEDVAIFEVLKAFRSIVLHLNEMYLYLKDSMNAFHIYLAGRDLRIMLINTDILISGSD